MNNNSNALLKSLALSFYLKLKVEGKDKTFFRKVNRNIEYIIKLLGNKSIKHLFNIF